MGSPRQPRRRRCVRPPSRSLPMFEREARIRRWFWTLPVPIRACTSHIGVLVHENRVPDVHAPGSAGRWRLRLHHRQRSADADPAVEAVDGRETPHLGMPRSASGRMAMYIPILASAAGSLSHPAVPCGKALARPPGALAWPDHGSAATEGRGATPPAANSTGARFCWGSKGQSPSPAPGLYPG